jgi:hypothetical protein
MSCTFSCNIDWDNCVYKLKQTILEPPRITWKGPIKTMQLKNLYHFLAIIVSISGLVWRDQLFWVKTLLKKISARDSSSKWLGQVYVRFTIWESFTRLLQHAATWNSKWSKILSIVWFHGQYVAFVLEYMHLLINIDDCF